MQALMQNHLLGCWPLDSGASQLCRLSGGSAEIVIGEMFHKLKKMITPDVVSIAEPSNREVLRKKEVDMFKIKCVLTCPLMDAYLSVLSQLVIAKQF